MFHLLKRVLQDRLRQQGVAGAVEAAQVTNIFRQIVAEKFGAAAAQGIRKVALISGDTIEVATNSPALASNLRMQENELKTLLHERCGGKSFRFRIFG